MRQRSTGMDSVLQAIGGIVIVFSILAAAFFWPSGPNIPQAFRSSMISTAFGLGFAGVVSGLVLIGFGTVVRLLDEIRAQGESSRKQLGTMASADRTEIPKTAEQDAGKLEVEGKTFSTVAEADAYRDLLKMIRR